MISKIKKLLTVTTVLIAFSFGLAPALSLAAVDCSQSNLSTQQAIQCGTNSAAGSTQDTSQASKNVDDTIATVINLLSIFVGIVAVIMIVIAGFRYVTSGGKQDSVSGAKNTILYAVIGLIIVALAQIIVQFVLNNTNSSGNTPGVSQGAADSPH
ncbi:MAG TPA: pilin [Candidatus Saccharimonadales bacterium]|nr:pilin [Candidatus Saccharimonadales bacterium]